jgi:hypothetical protein
MFPALFVPGLYVSGVLSEASVGRYVVGSLLAFLGLSFVVTLAAFLLFIFTVPLDISHKD